MDEDDYIYYKTRSKELIIRGGVNVYPVNKIHAEFCALFFTFVLLYFKQAEIERFLRTNEKVFDCYVVGVPDKRVGEEICAWIKLKSGETMSEEEAKNFCKGNIAYFKIPKYIKFVDSFPINATGKVQKFKIQEEMAKEMKD